MNPELWRRIEEAYHNVLACPPERHRSVLDECCGGDPELRREIESLLLARDSEADFLSPSGLLDQIAHLDDTVSAWGVGSTFGKYQILAAIGTGSTGQVYRARDPGLGRDVALKILHPELTHDLARVMRFQREARAASALQHPNTVTIYEIGQADGTWFIAAEFVEGGTVREALRGGSLGLEQSIRIALQCAEALGAAHRTSIVHRDIKPENIMVRTDGLVKVVDFGLALITAAQPEGTLNTTRTDVVMGTPRYMSPEQARGQTTDARSDIFSLGAVLLEMITGSPAFPGTTTAEVFGALLHSEPPTRQAGPARSVLTKALAKNPFKRYSSMEEFADGLRSVRPHARHPKLISWSFRLRFSSLLPRLATRWWLAGLLAAIAVLVVYLGFYPLSLSRERELSLVPLTAFPGQKDYPDFSPDGRQIAFSWRPAGQPSLHIFVKREGQQEPLQLTSSSHNDVLPAWSPDGKWIAFCRERPPGPIHMPHDLYIIPAGGGQERRVAQGWLGVSWSPDGKVIAAAELPNVVDKMSPASGGIFTLSIESGQRRDLTSGNPDLLPAFSPDGKWIAFIRRHFGVAEEVFVVPAGGGPARQLTFDRQPLRGVTWTTDSRDLIFASWRTAAQGSLWRISVRGGVAKAVSAGLRDASYPRVSRRGDRLAYTLSWLDTNIYMHTNQGWWNGAPRFGEAESTINSSRLDHSPAFSPNGQRVAFISNRSGDQEIWTSDRDGRHAVSLTSLGAASTGTPRWSPDGNWIAFDSAASGTSAIYVIASTGGTPRVVSAVSTGSWFPSWSPDGQWIYLTCRLSGARQIWKVPSTGGNAVQITFGGAYEGKPSPDGTMVYFTKPADNGCCAIWSVPAQGGAEKPVAELQRFDRLQRSWGVLKEGLYFVTADEDRLPVAQFLVFRSGRVSPLFVLHKQTIPSLPSLALSQDGRFAAAVQLDQSVNDLMMIGNFH